MSVIYKGLIGEGDISKYDGTNTTFTRLNSTGGTSTLTSVGGGNWIFAGTNSVKRIKANQGTGYSGVDAAIVSNAINGAGGWGLGAAVSAASGYDQAFTFTVTASGTPGANPTVVVTFKDGTWTNAPTCISKMVGGTGTIGDTLDASSATTYTLTYVGTPVAASTYTFTVFCMGR